MPEPLQEGVPPPEGLAEICADPTVDNQACSAASETVMVGTLSFPSESQSYNPGVAGHGNYFRPQWNCSALGIEGVKITIMDLAQQFFNSAGFDMTPATASRRVVTYGADRQSGRIHFVADFDLRQYDSHRTDGLGCNISSRIYLAWQENGEWRMDPRGPAVEFRRALRQALSR